MEEKKSLVSIIVRTKDRPKLLKNAIRSIAEQNYRQVEVVLVNDGGCDLNVEELKNMLGDMPLNYISLEKNTGRSHAGNIGIENAKGEYIGFLDDDDEFYPEHVETLVALLNSTDYMVAYTAVEFVEKSFDDNKLSFVEIDSKLFSEKDYSYDDLLITNYIPLISLLFKADLLKSVMFDESFDIFEDWDMLIRVAEKSKFYFRNKVTSRYNQWGNLQVAFTSPPEFIKQAALKIYDKHLAKFTPLLIYRLCIEEWANRPEVKALNGIIQNKDIAIEKFEREIQNFQNKAADKETVIQSIFNSKGWRYLQGYRRLRAKVRLLFS